MKGVRGTTALVIAGFTVFFIFLVFALMYKYDMNTFGDDLIRYTDTTREYNKEVFVTYEGKDYQIRDDMVWDLYGLIHRGSIKRKWLLVKPNLDVTDAAVAKFGDEVEITLVKASDKTDDDGCYIIYHKLTKNQTRYYYVNGYKTFSWLEKLLTDCEENQISHGMKNH